MEILGNVIHVFFTSIGSVAVMFIITKLIGNKQISQLNMFDYINGITIGSIAAEMATSLESDFLLPLTAMAVYGATACLLSLTVSRSLKARRFLNGRSIILYDKGKLYFDNFKRSKLDLNEFLTQCRVKGYFDLSKVETIFFEANGSISVLPKSDSRPVTPSDENLVPTEERPPVNVIVSGEVLDENLADSGRDRNWLNKRLAASGVKDASQVYLAYINNDDLTVYTKITGRESTPQTDIFA